MTEFEVDNNAKCVGAAVTCTHDEGHPCRACHVKAWAVLQAAGPSVVAAELHRLADEIAAETGTGSFSSGILRATVRLQQRAAELRGLGQRAGTR